MLVAETKTIISVTVSISSSIIIYLAPVSALCFFYESVSNTE